MIYTCTLNPSVDYIIHVEQFSQGGLNRGTNTAYYPGGKGINVSRVLQQLGQQNTALGFLGGFTGDFIKKELDKSHITHDFIETEGPTRVNMKLKSTEETEINGPGPAISVKQEQELLQKIACLKEGDYLVAAGSVPSTITPDFYVKAAALCRKNRVNMIADTSSQALKQIVGQEVFLVKPNHHELGELFDTTIVNVEDAVHYGQKLHEQGAEHVIISMGGQGAVYVSGDTYLQADVPAGEVRNTVGSGDSMVAGFLASIAAGSKPEIAFQTAVAAGSATAFQDDLCKRADVDSLLSHVTVHSLDKGRF
ncbi:1-phosphofructokinase [Sediminibacillus halophilus]|uniref:Tagatose-6-phosphate kinase n=1 Tax=Sediminibacillus halophilus TaxID=482461 RepID=A0A1G9R2E9_9BACI|nr:1-phosphofructokinase [Sediminibacillus halophilus]SDM17472.1 1-phosphofructokinase [Sediminibacillus halophilus]